MRRYRLAIAVLVVLALPVTALIAQRVTDSGNRLQQYESSTQSTLSADPSLSESYDSALGDTAQTRPISQPVKVTNFPGVQEVAGTVNVGNLPAVQEVTGTVLVESTDCGSSGPQFLGFSLESYNGGSGVFQLTRACQDTFGMSRVCTSEEVLRTSELPEILTGVGWVLPGIAAGLSSDAREARLVSYDVSGATLNSSSIRGNLSCLGWSSASSTNQGLVIDLAGRFLTLGCSSSRPVACCSLGNS